MKHLSKMLIVAVAFAAVAGLALAAGNAAKPAAPAPSAPKAASTTSTFHLEGACCDKCDAAVSDSLKKVSGVTAASCSHKDATVTVTYDHSKTNVAALEKTVAGMKNCHGSACKLTTKPAEAPKKS